MSDSSEDTVVLPEKLVNSENHHLRDLDSPHNSQADPQDVDVVNALENSEENAKVAEAICQLDDAQDPESRALIAQLLKEDQEHLDARKN